MHVFTCITFYFVVKIVSPCRIFKLATSSTGCIQHKIPIGIHTMLWLILHCIHY